MGCPSHQNHPKCPVAPADRRRDEVTGGVLARPGVLTEKRSDCCNGDWVVVSIIIHFNRFFHEINHPFWGTNWVVAVSNIFGIFTPTDPWGFMIQSDGPHIFHMGWFNSTTNEGEMRGFLRDSDG